VRGSRNKAWEMKIADKADMATRKKNMEGNNIIHKNSFAVFDSLVLVNKFNKMGGNSTTINLEHFDLLKYLEMTRNNLKERAESLSKESNEVAIDDLPSEEMRYIEWRLDSSNLFDIEGFQVVSRREKRKTK
jgi:uncharacterized membrane protein